MSTFCPYNPSATYTTCCQPLHEGAPAASAEALMRSRYTAYVLGLRDYLADTWHPSTARRRSNWTTPPASAGWAST